MASRSRRRFLRSGVLVGSLSLAGCLGSLGSGGDGPTAGDGPADSTDGERRGGYDCRTGRTAYASDAPLPADATWRMHRRDARNTSHNPEASVPRSVEAHWRYTACTEVDSGVTVAGGRVYAGRAVLDGTTGERTSGEWHGYQWPAVVDGTLYVGSHTLDAYDATDGTELWTFEPDGQAGAVSPPTVHDGTVYVAGNVDDPTLYAVDAETGTEEWRFSTATVLDTEREPDLDTAPAVAGDAVYVVTGDGTVYRLDAATGREQWQVADEAGGRWDGPPAVVDGTVYLRSTDGNLLALAASDGSERWRHVTESGTGNDIAVTPDAVFAANHDGCTSLSAEGGSVRWRVDTGAARGVTVAGDTVLLGGDATLDAVRRADGTPRWSFDTRGVTFGDYGAAGIEVAPAAVGDLVYVATAASDVYALGAAD